MPNMLTWDNSTFYKDGKPTYLVSGEFHYFRVPKQDWARRMRLFKEAGGDMIATYVPWIIHEPEEGHIIFGDCSGRDLEAFLKTAAEEELMVLLRPGPYQYSELVNDGLPGWLIENYPSLLAMTIDGKPFRSSSISYQHPLFLEKARRYFKAFADVVRPYMASNGGPVAMLQLDNELSGIHVWSNTVDYNPETMGFGKEDGYWPCWLKKRFSSVAEMNELYGTAYRSFGEVMPVLTADTPKKELLVRDYGQFYMDAMADYMEILASWLKEDGLNSPLCHNSGNPNMNATYYSAVKRLGKSFLLGSDHYYMLNPTWAQNNPTPQYAIKCLYSLDMLNAMGMPPSVLEMPGGNIADIPPMQPGDLLAAYMLHAAFGMKGVNYYIYTGGPNFPSTGNTCSVYDYHAPISADGQIQPSYQVLKTFGRFLKEHSWMASAQRVGSVQLGFSWKDCCFSQYQPKMALTGDQAWRMTSFDLLYALLCSSCQPELRALDREPDINKPLILVSSDAMSLEEQKRVADFVKKGGSLLILPILPIQDENMRKQTLLADELGIHSVTKLVKHAPYARVEGVEDVYLIQQMYTATLPETATPIAWDGDSNRVIGGEWAVGKGKVVWLGMKFDYALFTQSDMLETILVRMGARRVVDLSNRNLFATYWKDEKHSLIFVMNLLSGPQTTDVALYDKDVCQKIGTYTLAPMEVKVIEEAFMTAE